jgi:peptide/nickel transport system substrate-binding protein
MPHKRRAWLVGAVAGLVALTAIAAATATLRASRSDTLTIVQFADPDTLDPAVANDGVAGKVVQNIYDRLVRVSPDSKRISPSLATRWTVSKNGLTYTFFLRRGVRFHDGSAFNAEAVRYSLRRMIGIGKSDATKYKGRLSPRNIRVLGDYTVQLRLSRPYSGLLNLLGYFSGGSIVSPSWVKSHATKADPWAEKYMVSHANGTGAFKLNTWQRKQYIQLDRNESYWRGPAKVARVVYKTLADLAAARLQFERGDIDVITNISTDTYNALKRNRSVRVAAYPVLDNVFWVFNNQAEPFDDVRVRRALSYAVDYNGIIKLVGAGGTRMTGPLQPKLKEYNPNVQRYTRNIARAKALLAQAGYADGLTIESTVVEYGDLKPIGQILQANLADAGVTLKLKEQPFGPFLEDIASGKSKMFPWVTNPPLADPDAILYPPFHSKSPKNSDGNYTRYRNPKVDALLEKAQRSPNARVRQQAYKQVQSVIVADAPWIFLYYRNNLQGWRSNVRGYYWPLIGVPDLWGVRKS